MTWTLPLGHLPRFSLNQRLHWSERAELNRVWCNAAYYEARRAQIPWLGRARIQLVYYAPDRRRRDVDNLVAAQKACADAVVLAGIVQDDTPEHVDLLMPRIVPYYDARDIGRAGEYDLVVSPLEESC